MRTSWSTLGLLVPTLAAVLATILPASAYPSIASDSVVSRQMLADYSILSRRYDVQSRDGHSHHSTHVPPLLELNETELTMYHTPTPPSYWTIDIEDHDPDTSRYPGLIILHGLLMGLAFFVALPIGMCRSEILGKPVRP